MRIVVATVATLALAAVSTAQTPSAVRAASLDSPDRVVLVGCVVHDGESLFIRTLPSDSQTRRRSAGSNSAKGSTPIASTGDMVVPKTSAGSNSAKGSTPIPVSLDATGPRTSAVMSAKGSVPTATSAASFVSYELDAPPAQFSQPTNRVFEVSGRLTATSASSSLVPSLATRRVRVESVKVLPSSCVQ